MIRCLMCNVHNGHGLLGSVDFKECSKEISCTFQPISDKEMHIVYCDRDKVECVESPLDYGNEYTLQGKFFALYSNENLCGAFKHHGGKWYRVPMGGALLTETEKKMSGAPVQDFVQPILVS